MLRPLSTGKLDPVAKLTIAASSLRCTMARSSPSICAGRSMLRPYEYESRKNIAAEMR
jgi:hypothetical protein